MGVLQNKLAFITGSSRGIGKALALKLLDANYLVVGISRSSTIDHANYRHVNLNLNDISAVNAFHFDAEAKDVLLINNAGMIGEISPIGQMSNTSIQAIMNVNSIAPQILMNKFVKKFTGKINTAHILNISSGAGKNPIDAWATYCASKAALDLFSETIHAEFQERNMNDWYIHSIAPGVADTKMQEEIRAADPESFKVHEKFVSLKKEGELAGTVAVAEKLFLVISNPSDFEKPIDSVRNF